MVVLPAAILVGAVLGYLAGGSIRGLERLTLRGEVVMLVMLAMQTALPLLRVHGLYVQLAYAVWFGTFPVMILLCLLNAKTPGLCVVAGGLLLNMLVIGLNGAMPVSPTAVATVSRVPLVVARGDFAHVAATGATRLRALSDVLPISGPAGLRSVVSAGDILLVCGVVGAMLASMLGVTKALSRTGASDAGVR